MSELHKEQMMIDPTIHITRWGDAGSKIVLIHGGAQGNPYFGGDRHFPLQQRLGERGYQVIVPDRPGHGRSPYPGRPDDAEADGTWVAELLGDGVHLVGHSFGACVALAAAAMKPASVRSLTMIEPAMPKLAMNNPRVMKFGLSLMMATVFSASTESRTHKFSRIVGIPPELRGIGGAAEAKKVGEALKVLKLPSKAQLTGWLEVVKKAQIPLLVVSGGWNPAFEALSDTVAKIGGGRRLVIRSTHHFPQSISDEFNQTIAGIVASAEAKRAPANSLLS
jgi:pimeloyl-ACP methyl ester carboxylesterase